MISESFKNRIETSHNCKLYEEDFSMMPINGMNYKNDWLVIDA